jgi:micrococcal nuclease
VTIAPPDMRAFRRAGMNPPMLTGKRVRVRGWLEFYNGPEMEIASPGAIEVLDNENSPDANARAAPRPKRN